MLGTLFLNMVIPYNFSQVWHIFVHNKLACKFWWLWRLHEWVQLLISKYFVHDYKCPGLEIKMQSPSVCTNFSLQFLILPKAVSPQEVTRLEVVVLLLEVKCVRKLINLLHLCVMSVNLELLNFWILVIIPYSESCTPSSEPLRISYSTFVSSTLIGQYSS
jgi:hypothetical protein